MNKDQIKKNLHAHVQLVPPAYRLDKNGLEQRPVSDDDWWLIAAIGDEGVTISDPRTGHVKMLGYDHIYKFTSDEPKNGAKRGFLSLHVQLFVQGNSVSVLPNARPGEPVAPKRVEITNKLVEIGMHICIARPLIMCANVWKIPTAFRGSRALMLVFEP